MLKHLFLLCCLGLLLACESPNATEQSESTAITATSTESSTSTPTHAAPAAEDPIESIRSRFKATMAGLEDGSLTKSAVAFECDEDPISGEIWYYTDASGSIKMIEDSYTMGDHGGKTIQYFLDDGELYFQFVTIGSWQFDVDGEGTIDRTEEYRYYVDQDQLIRCLKKAYEVSSKDNTTPKAKNEPTDCPDLASLKEAAQRLEALRNQPNAPAVVTRCSMD